MKKALLAFVLAAVSVGLMAADAPKPQPAPAKDTAAGCCSKTKAAEETVEPTSGCCGASSEKTMGCCSAKGSKEVAGRKNAAKQQTLLSPKAAGAAAR